MSIRSTTVLFFTLLCFPSQAQWTQHPAHTDRWSTEILEVEITSKEALGWKYKDGLRYNFRNLGQYENLEASHIVSVCEDSRGQLWLGGIEGEVIRYDGYHFYTYHIEPFVSQRIMKIEEDGKGRIWIGSYGQGLVCLDGIHSLHIKSDGDFDLGHLFVTDIVVDKSSLWICTDQQGLVRLDENQFSVFDKSSGLKDNRVEAFALNGSEAWIGYFNNGVDRLNEKGITHFGVNEGLADSLVSALLIDKNKTLWIATKHGLAKKLSGNSSFTSVPEMNGRTCWDLEWCMNRLFIATNGQGLFSIEEKGKLMHYDNSNGLHHDRLIELECDADGNLWIGTLGGGLGRYNEDVFVNYNESSGLLHNQAWSVLAAPLGETYFGHSGGGVSVLENGVVTPFTFIPELNQSDVLDIFMDSKNLIWFTAGVNGVFSYDPYRNKEVKHYPFSDDVAKKQVTSIIQSSEGKMFFGSWNGLLELREGKLSNVNFTSGKMDSELWDMAYDDKDNLWCAGRQGIFIGQNLLDSNQCKALRIDSVPGFKWKEASCVINDRRGNMWVGSDGGGIIIFSQQAASAIELSLGTPFALLDESSGLPSNFIAALHHTDEGIWVGTKSSVTLVTMEGGEFKLPISTKCKMKNFGLTSGLINPEIAYNNVAEDAEGNLWWCGLTQVSKYNPSLDVSDKTIPQLSITGIDLFFEQVEWKNEKSDPRIHSHESYFGSLLKKYIHFDSLSAWNSIPVLPVFSHDQNHLTFQLAATDWNDEERIIYRVKLDGFDQNWIELGSARSITYSALPYGQYVFNCEATNATGLVSKAPAYTFTIMPPYWKTQWFIISVVCIFLLLLYLIFKWRVRQLQKDKRKLESKVNERTEQLRAEKNKSENLLLNILPKETAEELKEKGMAETHTFASASVLFSDFSGFTALTQTMDSKALVSKLDMFFKAFDNAGDKYRIEKIKTIGDAYMCAAGVPHEYANHAIELVAFGLEMIHLTNELNSIRATKKMEQVVAVPRLIPTPKEIETPSIPPWEVRIGIHSGPLIAGVVGSKKFAFDIWGDTVNTASRIETSGAPGRLNISAETAKRVNYFFDMEPRGFISAKGKGEVEMYFVRGFKKVFAQQDNPLLPNAAFFDRLKDTEVG